MKNLYPKLTTLILMTLFVPSALPLAAQKADAAVRPKSAVPGSTAERRAALSQLTPEQRQEFLDRSANFDPALRSAVRQRQHEAKPKAKPRWVRGDLFGRSVRSLAAGAGIATWDSPLTRSTTDLKSLSTESVSSLAYSGPDLEGDGLPDDFEDAVADAFTPVYHVSSGEQAGTGFARFADSTSLSIVQNLPAVPPVSHFRVTPVGFAYTTTGQQFGFLQIDYLTLWNRDDGLDVGGDCRFYASVLGGLVGYALADILDGFGPHEYDQERSAALVAAPTTGSFQY
ncbi:MAG TPA: hypothetical protein VEG34_18185, partial [Thermoanaerobaculia bacterium]|nr:hypothetical protein [Thermoanaerobaculia bacterium]